MATDPRARVRFVSIVAEPLVLETGHWCRACALPSGVRQVIAVRSGDRMYLSTAVRCLDCDGVNVEVDPDRIGRTR